MELFPEISPNDEVRGERDEGVAAGRNIVATEVEGGVGGWVEDMKSAAIDSFLFDGEKGL